MEKLSESEVSAPISISRSASFYAPVDLKSARNSLVANRQISSDLNLIFGVADNKENKGIVKALRNSISSTNTQQDDESASSEYAKKRWKFVRAHRDVLTKKSVIEKFLMQKYEHYSDVPSTSQIVSALYWEKQHKSKVLNLRRNQFYSQETKSMHTIQSVAAKELLAKKIAKERKSNNEHAISTLIEILRMEHSQRSIKQLKVVLSWLQTHCPKNALIYNFLQRATTQESLEFCRGLNYRLYDKNEAIIRQGETGDAYYILLSGKAGVYINKNLWAGEIANENKKKTSSQGIGDKIDLIHPGCDFGELALLEKVPRSASIICTGLSISECLVCMDKHFQDCMNLFAKRCAEEFVKDLRRFYIMKNVDDVHMKMIFKRFERKRLFAGKVLYAQGCNVDNVYFIINGQCAEWYEMPMNDMMNKEKKYQAWKKKKEVLEFRIGEDTEKEMDAEANKKRDKHNVITPQFKRTELSLLECNNSVIGGYYALKKIVAPTTLICKTDCEAIMCSSDKFVKSANLSMTERTKQIGKDRHNLVNERIRNYKNMANILSQSIGKSKEEAIIEKMKRNRSKSAIIKQLKEKVMEENPTLKTAMFSRRAKSVDTMNGRDKSKGISKQTGNMKDDKKFGMYTYIGPKDKRIRSASLILDPKMSINTSVKLHYDETMKLQENVRKKENVIRALPKVLKQCDPENEEQRKDHYIKMKKRFRSSSLKDLQQKYGVPTDIWQIDASHAKTRARSMSSSLKNVKCKKKHERRMRRSKSAINLALHQQKILKEYEKVIPNEAGGSYEDVIQRDNVYINKKRKKKRSQSSVALRGKQKKSIGIRKRSASNIGSDSYGKKRNQRSRSMKVMTDVFINDMNDMEYKRLKKSYSVLNLAFKEYKKGTVVSPKQRGPVAIKGKQKLNQLSKDVKYSRKQWKLWY